jgi:hypothetical protein
MLDNIILGIVNLAGRIHGNVKSAYVILHQEEGAWHCDVHSTIPLKPAVGDKKEEKWTLRGTGNTPEIATAQTMQKLLTQVKQRSAEDVSAIATAEKGYSTLSESARAAAFKPVA